MLSSISVAPLAHIGNIPVEEWLPFVVPLVALYVYGRHRERRRRAAVAVLPEGSGSLDEATVSRIVAGWRAAKYQHVSREHLPLLYPPGPDDMSILELADRTDTAPDTVETLLRQLEDGEYLVLEGGSGSDARASLTLQGFGLVDATEDSLLTALREPATPFAGATEHPGAAGTEAR
jgi:hypothetical protein